MLSLEYLAGMVDADGCILAHSSNHKYIYPRLTVTNTSWELMEELIKSFGGHSIKKHSKGKGTFINRVDCYDWRLDGDAARKLITNLIPLLFIKKQKAIDVLAKDTKKQKAA